MCFAHGSNKAASRRLNVVCGDWDCSQGGGVSGCESLLFEIAVREFVIAKNDKRFAQQQRLHTGENT